MQTGDSAGEGLSLQSVSLVQGRCGPPQKPLLQTPSAAQSASLVHLPVVAPGGTVPLPAQLMFTLQLSQAVIRHPPPAAWAAGLVSQPSLSLAFASSHSSITTHGKQSSSVEQHRPRPPHRPLMHAGLGVAQAPGAQQADGGVQPLCGSPPHPNWRLLTNPSPHLLSLQLGKQRPSVLFAAPSSHSSTHTAKRAQSASFVQLFVEVPQVPAVVHFVKGVHSASESHCRFGSDPQLGAGRHCARLPRFGAVGFVQSALVLHSRDGPPQNPPVQRKGVPHSELLVHRLWGSPQIPLVHVSKW